MKYEAENCLSLGNLTSILRLGLRGLIYALSVKLCHPFVVLQEGNAQNLLVHTSL